MRTLLPLLIAFCVLACARSTAHVPDAPELESNAPRTYAWADAVPPELAYGEPETDEGLLNEARVRLDEALQHAGYELVAVSDARLIAAFHLGIEERTRELDPEWSFYRVEKIEEAWASLALTSAASGELLWSSEIDFALRVTGRGFGATTTQWTGTEERREWRIDRTVEKLARELP